MITIIKNGYDLCLNVLLSSDSDVSSLVKLSKGIESDWLEFKASIRPIDQDLNKYDIKEYFLHTVKAIVALANSSGGAVLLGVNNEGSPVGVRYSVENQELYNWDNFYREDLRKAIFRKSWVINKNFKICRKSTDDKHENLMTNTEKRNIIIVSLSHSLEDIVDIRKGKFNNEDVAVILVKPMPFDNSGLIEIVEKQEDTGAETRCFLIRSMGDIGNTRRLSIPNQCIKYSKDRILNEQYFKGLWQNYLSRKRTKKEFLPHELIDDYLKLHILNKPELYSSYNVFIDLQSSSEIQKNQFLLEYADFEVENYYQTENKHNGSQIDSDERDKLIAEEIIESVNKAGEKYLVVGPAGSGKTTLLRYIAYKFALDKKHPIPIYLNLNDNCVSIQKEGLTARIASNTGIDLQTVRDLMSKGKIILLLDGYNEIIQEFLKIIYINLASLINDYPLIRFIITSRQGFFIEGFEKSIKIRRIKALSKDQVIKMLVKRIQDDNLESRKQKANKIWETATKIGVLKGILMSPFYVTILLELFSFTVDKDMQSSGKIIRRFCSIILKREIIKDKSVSKANFHKIMYQLKQFLFKISYELIKSGQQVITYKNIYEFNIASEMINYAIGSTILEQISENQLKFKHQNFLEYFAAEYLIENMNYIPEILKSWDTEILKGNEDEFFFREEKIRTIVISAELFENATVFLNDKIIKSLNAKWREVLLLGIRTESADKALSDYCSLKEIDKNPWVINEERNVRKAAALSLSLIDSNSTRKELIELSKDEEHTTRLFATVALGKCQPNQDIYFRLTELIFDENPNVSVKAIKSIYGQRQLSKITLDLLRCYSAAVYEHIDVIELKTEIKKRLSNKEQDLSFYLKSSQALYEEFKKLIKSTKVRDIAILLLSHFGPAVDPPMLKGEESSIYNGVFYKNPFPGIIISNSFSSPVPCIGITGGINDGQSILFSVKKYYNYNTFIVDKLKAIRS